MRLRPCRSCRRCLSVVAVSIVVIYIITIGTVPKLDLKGPKGVVLRLLPPYAPPSMQVLSPLPLRRRCLHRRHLHHYLLRLVVLLLVGIPPHHHGRFIFHSWCRGFGFSASPPSGASRSLFLLRLCCGFCRTLPGFAELAC